MFSKTFPILILTLAFGFSAFAQVSNVTDFGGVPLRTKSQTQRFSGNPYATEGMVKGFIISTNNKQSEHFIKYNVLDDKLEYMKGTDMYEVSSPTINGFIMEVKNPKNNITERLLYKNGIRGIDGVPVEGFFEVLYEGKHRFLHKTFMKLKPATATYGGMQPEIGLESEERYYLLLPNGEFKAVKYNNNSILKTLGNNPTHKAFVKENKINMKNKLELQKFMKYLDEQSTGK